MKICVVSDSHGETKNIDKIIENINFDLLIHLGDNYSDMDEVKTAKKFMRVPGVRDKEYFSEEIEKRIIVKFGKFRFLLTHTLNSHENHFTPLRSVQSSLRDDAEAGRIIKPEELYEKNAVDVVLFGHTHKPEISYDGKILFINPGHLKTHDDRGYEPSYVILDVEEKLKIENFKFKL